MYDLEARVSKCRKDCDEATVTVLRCRQLNVFGAEGRAVNDVGRAWYVSDGPLRGQRVVREPLIEKVSIFSKANSHVLK